MFISILVASLLLWQTEPVTQKKLRSPAELDSLISSVFEDIDLPHTQLRRSTVVIDSLFSRSVYRVRVAPNFSKTTLHYTLQQAVWPYKVSTVGKVEFPDRILNLHFMVNDNILSSVIISDDPDLRVRQSQPVILPGQDSHEVD